MSSDKSWPDLVGKPVDKAVAAIQNEDPNLNVIKVPEGSPVTYDLRWDRVRVFYDTSGNVSSMPTTANMSSNKSWPDLVGKPVDEAVATIQNENPNLNVLKIPEDSIVTCDLRMDRVRVFYDKNGSVSSAPTIG